MRIIAGRFRGKKLIEFKGDDIRPTSDRARESLFNILYDKVIDCSFLDLFCGTGAVGIEAISRGAKIVSFVDEAKESIEITKTNLKSIKCEGNIITKDALNFVKEIKEKYDIIFMDPPYSFDKIEDILKVIKERSLLKGNGIVIYEHKDNVSFGTEVFEIYNSRRYGIARFEFMRNKV